MHDIYKCCALLSQENITIENITLLSKPSMDALFGQQSGIFIVAMLGLDNNVVYLLLPCLVWTSLLYIYCCHAWFGQQCGIFTVAMLGLNNNVIYLLCCPSKTLPLKLYHIVVQTKHGNSKSNHIVVQAKHGNSKYTTLWYIYCCHALFGQ
jgi:hypothetical protein